MGWHIVSGPKVGLWVTEQTQGGFDPQRSEEARIKGAAHDSGDIVLMTQTPDKCRYLEPRYGQKITSATANA